jgi:hypothetical protein
LAMLALEVQFRLLEEPRGRKASEIDAEDEGARLPDRRPDHHKFAGRPCLEVALVLFQLAIEA